MEWFSYMENIRDILEESLQINIQIGVPQVREQLHQQLKLALYHKKKELKSNQSIVLLSSFLL